MTPGAVPGDNEIQPTREFQRDLRQLRIVQMKQALELTHGENGRHVASKLYAYISNLTAYYEQYGELLAEARETTVRDAIKTVLAQLLQLKTRLRRAINMAARQGLDDIDEDFANKLETLYKDIHSFAEIRQSGRHIDRIAQVNFVSTVIYYGTIVASYLTKGLQGFLHSLPTLLSNLGRVFPPIIIALDAAKNIFDLTYSLATHSHLKDREDQTGKPLASSPLYNKGYFLRLAGNAIALALNVFTLLIFTGALFTTPFGWALSAAVIAAEWVPSCIVPAWQTRKNYKQLQENIRNLNPVAVKADIKRLEEDRTRAMTTLAGVAAHREVTRINQQINQLRYSLDESAARLQLAEKSYFAKRADALWAFCSIAGSVVFACGFLCPPLFGVGVLLLLASPARTVFNWLADKFVKCFQPTIDANDSDQAASPNSTTKIQAAMRRINSFEQKHEHLEALSAAKELSPPPSPSPMPGESLSLPETNGKPHSAGLPESRHEDHFRPAYQCCI